MRQVFKSALLATVTCVCSMTMAFASPISSFTGGDLVIDTVSGSALDAASPITLQEFALGVGGQSATSVGHAVLIIDPL